MGVGVGWVQPCPTWLLRAAVSFAFCSALMHARRGWGWLQGFQPQLGRYDVIWIQWAIGHLTDDDFVLFFAACAKGLTADGIVVVKENNCSLGFLVDKDDSSVTRSDKYFRELFKRCNYELFLVEKQKGFPKELFAVRMYALKPIQKRGK
jgi:protein N-terminal methyltransferase